MGEHENVRINGDGTVELSTTNLLPNAELKDTDSNGALSQWATLAAPLKRVGWNVYARAAPGVGTTPRFARQNTSVLSPSTSSYSQYGLLTQTGVPPPTSGVLEPDASSLKSVAMNQAGLGAGWYGVALAWCVFSTEYPNRRFTGLSPRATVQVATGADPRRIAVNLYDRIPDGPVGLGVFATEPQSSSANALTAPVYLQHVVSTNPGEYVTTYYIEGPLRTGELGTTTNESFVGAYEDYDEPFWDYASSSDALARPEDVEVQVSWSFRTRFGRSASQKIAPDATIPGLEWIPLESGSGSVLRVRPPSKPTGALDWRVEWRGQGGNATGNWYTYTVGSSRGSNFGTYAYIFTADEESAALLQEQYQFEAIDRSHVDNTGTRTPDLAPPGLAVSIITPPTETSVEVITTWVFEDGTESGPSPTMALSGLVAGTDTWRVYLPPGGNLLPNPEFELRARKSDGSGTTLQDWTEATGTGLAFTTAGGEATLVDSSGSSATTEVFYNEHIVVVDPDESYSIPLDFEVFDYTSGRARVILRELLGDGTTNVDTVLVSFSAADSVRSEVSIGPVAGANYPLDPDTRGLRLVVQNADAGTGVRDLSWRLTNAGIFLGLVPPRKRYAPANSVVSVSEDVARSYPIGAYCVVVEDPPDDEKPADLVGIDVNMIEYYGPPEQALSDFLGPRGLRIPVQPEETFTFSAYLEGKGLPEAPDGAQMLRVDFKNGDGISLGLEGESLELAALEEYSAWLRYSKTVTSPADASYLEVVGNRQVGPGRIRIIAPQFELGEDATDFSTEVADEGYVTVTFDTALTGLDAGDPLNTVRAIEEATVVATLRDPTIGSVTAQFASSADNVTYTSYVDDIADMPRARYIRIKATLSGLPL